MKRDLLSQIDTIANQSFRLGMVSLARPSSYCPDIVAGVANFIFRNGEEADAIIITGDLATTGMHTDLGVAKTFVTEPAVLTYKTQGKAPTLNSNSLPVYLLAGNHDRFTNNRAAPSSRNFDFVFSDHLGEGYDGFVGEWIVVKDGARVAFISADFSLRHDQDVLSSAHVYGQGKVYDDTLDKLRRRTFDIKGKHPDAVLVWLIHFAPFECGVWLELQGWDAILKAAEAAGVQVTLCGHTHVPRRISSVGHTVYCAGSAGCADSEENSYVHIIEVEVGDSVAVTRQNYKWNAEQDEFVLIGAD